jgi:hypothetical protein
MVFSHPELIEGAFNYTQKYLNQKDLGRDEQLQLMSCAYAHLYLKAANQATFKELGDAHMLIADCFKRLGDQVWADKHKETAQGYFKQV